MIGKRSRPWIDNIPKSQRKQAMADKGFKSKANDRMLKDQGSKSSIMHKGNRNNPRSDQQKKYNKAMRKTPWVVEQTFGSLKRWMGAGVPR